MAGTVPVLTYLPIDTYGTTDTVNVPKLDIMRGDITPAVLVDKGLGNGLEIVNNPTPFYMLCTAKVFNGYTQINTIVKNSILQEAYQQFGVTQGSATYFPGTNSDRSNAQDKRNFFLNTFQSSFLKPTNSSMGESPGLLVPMYCGYNPLYGFYFFRADVFYDSTIPGTNTQVQLPEQPIAYGDPKFPHPIGKKISQFYHLASVYTNSARDQNRIGTWSAFLTDSDIATYVGLWNNFKDGPTATRVYIQFNVPKDGSFPVVQTKLSSSEIYTVINMYQDSPATLIGSTDVPDVQIKNYSQYSSPSSPILGYPLNFLYAVGGNYYKNMQGITPPTVYQNNSKSYLGNITQSATNGWDVSSVAKLFQGTPFKTLDNKSFVFNTIYTRGFITTNTEYKCYCAGSNEYNGLCIAKGGSGDTGIFTNGVLSRYSRYYSYACNSINAGTWQFLAYQFVPLNFYNPPPKTLAPQILPSLTTQITFPNKTTGPNQWPTGGLPPNTITNITIADTLYNWLDNPTNIFCGNIVNSFPYCGFSDYYLSLMRVFYDKGDCGDYYDPPDTTVTPLSIGGKSYFYSNSCTQGLTKGICVPNYQYLLDPTATGTILTVLSGTPQILSNTSVNMIKPNDGITTDDSFNTMLKSVYISMILPNVGNAVFEIGITDEHTTRISQGIVTPFGNASSNVAYRSRQLLKIEFLNDILKTANLYLDGVKIASKIGYTQGPNQNLYFKYISASPTASYKFNGIFYGLMNGSLIKPFQCLPLTDPVPTDPVTGSTNGIENIRVASLSSPFYQDIVKDVITWQNLEDYIFSYPQNVVPNNQVNYQPAPALPQNVVNALNGNNPTSGSTTPKSSSGNLYLIIGIVVAIIVIGLIIFFIVRSNKNRVQEKKIQISPYQYKVV